jgi:hypothetical protein
MNPLVIGRQSPLALRFWVKANALERGSSTRLALSHYRLQSMTASLLPTSPWSLDLVELSTQIQAATLGITECLEMLNQLQLTHCLPITAYVLHHPVPDISVVIEH